MVRIVSQLMELSLPGGVLMVMQMTRMTLVNGGKRRVIEMTIVVIMALVIRYITSYILRELVMVVVVVLMASGWLVGWLVGVFVT